MSGTPDRSALDAALDAAGSLVAAGAAEVCCDLGALRGGLDTVDRLARLHLAAGRRRTRLEIRTTDDELHRLVRLAGLAEVLFAVPPTGRRPPDAEAD